MIKNYITFITENKDNTKILSVDDVEELVLEILNYFDNDKNFENAIEKEYKFVHDKKRPTSAAYKSKKTRFGYRLEPNYDSYYWILPSVRLTIGFDSYLDPYGENKVEEDIFTIKKFREIVNEWENDTYERWIDNLLKELTDNLFDPELIEYELEGGATDEKMFKEIIDRFKKYLKDNNIKINSTALLNIIKYLIESGFEAEIEEYLQNIFGDDLLDVISDILKEEPEKYTELAKKLPDIMSNDRFDEYKRSKEVGLWDLRK